MGLYALQNSSYLKSLAYSGKRAYKVQICDAVVMVCCNSLLTITPVRTTCFFYFFFFSFFLLKRIMVCIASYHLSFHSNKYFFTFSIQTWQVQFKISCSFDKILSKTEFEKILYIYQLSLSISWANICFSFIFHIE